MRKETSIPSPTIQKIDYKTKIKLIRKKKKIWLVDQNINHQWRYNWREFIINKCGKRYKNNIRHKNPTSNNNTILLVQQQIMLLGQGTMCVMIMNELIKWVLMEQSDEK